MRQPLVVAHRGYSARFPENSLVAIEQAIASGCDVVEVDARLSVDGTVWCVHDGDLERLAGRSMRIAEADSTTLANVRLHSGERLATLPQVLEWVAGRVAVLIDVKTTDLRTAGAVVEVARAPAGAGPIWFGFRAAEQVKEARRLLPAARCLGFLPEYDGAPVFEAAGAQAVRVWEGHIEQPAAARLFAHWPVWVTSGGFGTGAEPGDVGRERLERIVARGVAAVLLNDPTLLTSPRLNHSNDDGSAS
jgi:glycerophosphoryl diester phosphodiesterase